MPVQTRRQLKQEIQINQETKIKQPIYEEDPYEFVFDFDEASEAWKANKISIGNGSYRYMCANKSEKNRKCLKKCLHGEIYCKTHYKPL